ncbi:LADA_0D01090g1_1 [Lachancea dasiensis]|uniref:LADA_0D01090g1_1 n=1 Tax=Lachancea dasiensis TaxID=1072105 RepID=A0A1G4J3N1_9SACH|nr:LADA_0D01090g1_1 [Lachancea dasiensis]
MTTTTADSVRPDFDDAAGFLGVEPQSIAAAESSLISAICAKAHEFHQLQAQNLEYSVVADELRSTSDRKTSALKTQIQNILQELETARSEGRESGTVKSRLESELQNAQAELQTILLQNKTLVEQREILEGGKKEVGDLLKEKIQDNAALKRETESLLTDSRQLRSRCLELETDLREAKSQQLNGKAEFYRLSQELELANSNISWQESQLSQLNSNLYEYKQRSEQEILAVRQKAEKYDIELQGSRQNIALLKEENSKIANDLRFQLDKVKRLTDELNSEKHEFAREIDLKQRLIDLLERQVQSLKDDLELHGPAHQTTVDPSKIMEQLNQSTRLLSEKEVEIEKLQDTVQELLSMKGTDESPERSTLSVASNPTSIPQLYGDISVLKKELIHERRQKEHLQNQVEAFVVELEAKVPMLTSFKDRNEMLEKELRETAYMLESVSKNKDDMKFKLERILAQSRDYENQILNLTRQRTDLAHQVQFLLVQVSVKNDSNGPLTVEETAFVKKILDSEDFEVVHDTQKVISQRLVEFENIVGLQSKNAELLVTIRNLADKLEAEEKQAKARSQKIDGDVIKEAKEAITTLQEHIKELEMKLEVITKERDAFKTIHQTPQSKSPHAAANGTSDDRSHDKIEEFATHLKVAKQEAETNMKMLNTELQGLLKSRTELLVEVEKQKSSKVLAEERLRISQESLNYTKQENNQLSERYHRLQENILQQDTRTQETISELIKCKSQVATLNIELKNSTSRFDVLKISHEEAKKDNDRIIKERNDLSILVSQLQTLQNERTAMLTNAEKSFQEKISFLDQEVSMLRSQLSAKTDELSTFLAGSDSKSHWYQEKIDSLNTALSELTEKLTTQTQIAHELEGQCKVLKDSLKESETKVHTYRVASDAGDSLTHGENMRKELELTQISLKDAYSQVEEYRNLYNTTGEALSKMTTALEALKSEHSNEILSLQKQEESLKDEISKAKADLATITEELRKEKDRAHLSKTEYDNQLSAIELDKKSIDDIKNHFQAQVDQLTADLHTQASYANKAQRDFEQVLQRHADDSRSLSILREESQSFVHQIKSLEATCLELNKSLEDSEKSWALEKEEYETQLAAFSDRVEDLLTQNRLLFEQISLHDPKSPAHSDTGDGQRPIDDLILTLRRECEIYQTKLEVTKNDESLLRKRLKLMENDLLLAQEKVKSYESTENKHSTSAEDHKEILRQLDQLNLLRESNITLRNELQEKSKVNQDLEAKIKDLESLLEPLRVENQKFSGTLANRDQQLILLEEEVKRWKQRSQDILHTYERVDPEEHRGMIDELTKVKAELLAKNDQNAELEDRFQRLKKQARERLDTSRAAQTALNAEVNELREEKKSTELSLQKERETIKQLEEVISTLQNENATQDPHLQEELNNALQKLTTSDARIQDLEQQITNSDSQSISELDSLREQVKGLEDLLDNARKEAINQEATRSSASDIEDIKENIRRELAEHSDKILQEREFELKAKYQEMQAEQEKMFEQKLAEMPPTTTEDIDALKKEWEADFEKKTQKRIEEANELLRKRIRLPTEERINKIIENRRAELEQAFDSKVERRATEISRQDPTVPKLDDITEKYQKEIEDLKESLKKEMEGEIAQAKKKAFDEGKQQAGMKSIFLEKKIAKLEAQVKANNPSVSVSSNNSAGSDLAPPNNVGGDPNAEKPGAIAAVSPSQVSDVDNITGRAKEGPLAPIKTQPFAFSIPSQGQIDASPAPDAVSSQQNSSPIKRSSSNAEQNENDEIYNKRSKSEQQP